MATPAESRAKAAEQGKDVTPVMAEATKGPKVVRVVWEDKGPEEQEFDQVEHKQTSVKIKRLGDK